MLGPTPQLRLEGASLRREPGRAAPFLQAVEKLTRWYAEAARELDDCGDLRLSDASLVAADLGEVKARGLADGLDREVLRLA